jgi:hypothetical protein
MAPSGGNYTNNSIWYVYLKNETIGTLVYDTFRGNLNLTATNTLPYVVWTYPADGATGIELPLTNISAYFVDDNGDTMNITWWTTKGDDNWTTWYNEIGWNYSTHNGTNMSNQTFNYSQRYNTRWRWGNTTYTWGVNISDGTEWANYTFTFTTNSTTTFGKNARYDVTTENPPSIDVSDISATWNNRGGMKDYLGLYDVANYGDVDVSDISAIWNGRDGI